MKTSSALLLFALLSTPTLAQVRYLLTACETKVLEPTCNSLSSVAQLTDSSVAYQVGIIRSDTTVNLSNGTDLRLCLLPGKHGGSGFTLMLHQGEHKGLVGSNCDTSLTEQHWRNFNYLQDPSISAYFAIKIETFEQKPDMLSVMTEGGQKLQFGPYPVLDVLGQPFDLDGAGAVTLRFVFDPADHLIQLYLNDVLHFLQGIDLIGSVFQSNEAYIAVTASTDSVADFQGVRLADNDYSLCNTKATCEGKEDFQHFIQDGPSKRALWTGDGSTSVTQTYNKGLSIVRDKCKTWVNHQFTFNVKPSSASGMWGFLLGGKDADPDRTDDFHGLAFLWWPSQQTFTDPTNPARTYTAQPGMALVRMSGALPDGYAPGGTVSCFAGLQPCPAFEVLATVPGVAWQPGPQSDRIEVDYTVERVKIKVNGTLYLDVPAPVGKPFEEGYFGFCTYDQSGITFSNLEYKSFDTAAVPGYFCTSAQGEMLLLNHATQSIEHLQSVIFSYGEGGAGPEKKDTLSGADLKNRLIHKTFDVPHPAGYDVEVRYYMSGPGCYFSQTYKTEVIYSPPVTLPPDPDTLCSGAAFPVNVFDHTDPHAKYLWSTGDNTPYLVIHKSGTYRVEKTTQIGTRECPSRDSITVRHHPAADLSIVATAACEDQQNGAIAVKMSGGTAPFQYALLPNAPSSEPDFEKLPPEQYKIVVTDGAGCTYAQTALIGEIARPDLLFEVKNARCFGEKNGALLIQNAQSGLLFSLDGFSLSSKTLWAGLPAGAYTLLCQEPQGCEFAYPFSIAEPPRMTAQIAAPSLIALGDSALLLGSVQQGTQPFAWRWRGPGRDTACSCPQFVDRPVQDAAYTLVVTDSAGCTALTTHRLAVQRESLLYLPNIIKPVGFGPESRWWPQSAAGSVLNIKALQIFNRGGDKVFEQANFLPDLPERGWDGRYREGKLAQAGVYTYRLVVKFADGSEQTLHGGITVMH